VRVFVHRTGKLFAEYRREGRKVRYSMGHTDRAMAKVEADSLAASLRQPDRPEPILIGQFFENYLREVTPTKALSTQKHDRTTIERFRLFFGPERRADSLTHRDAAGDEYERRKGGDLRPRAKTAKKVHHPVRSRSIVYDLRKLKAVLTWGVHAGVLDRNMLTGYKVADDGTPHRPVFTEPQYRALLKTADAFPWQFGSLLVIAHETGHRLNAMLTLQWRDVDLTMGRITWRRENDKIGYEHVTPMTVVKCYQRPSEDAMRAAQASRRMLDG
jgi:integrase